MQTCLVVSNIYACHSVTCSLLAIQTTLSLLGSCPPSWLAYCPDFLQSSLFLSLSLCARAHFISYEQQMLYFQILL